MKAALAAGALALVITSSPALAKKDKKPNPKVVAAMAEVSAPEGPLKPVRASWPVGVVGGTPTIAADAVLPTNTEITIKLNQELSSKSARAGDKFTGTVASDVMLGNMVVIPKGTPANGLVTWRTGKGAFGKSAKMEYEYRSIDLNGQRIPISSKYREEGRGNTGAAVGAVVAVGIFGAFVTGRSAVIAQGTESKVNTTAPVPIELPAGAQTASAN